jgi:PAS domain S-box-containing protein
MVVFPVRRGSGLSRLLLAGMYIACLAVSAGAETVTVTSFPGYAPVTDLDADGNPAGFYPELLVLLFEDIGYDVSFVTYPSFTDAYQAFSAGEVDIMTTFVKTPERAERFLFPEEPVMVTWSEVFTIEGQDINSVFDLENAPVALIQNDQNGSNFIALMESFDLSFQPVWVDSISEGIETIRGGDAVAVVAFSTARRRVSGMITTSIVFSPSEGHIAANNPALQPLLETFDRRLRDLKRDGNSYYHALFTKWMTADGGDSGVPLWLLLVLSVLAFLLVLVAAFAYTLRRAVEVAKQRIIRTDLKYKIVADNTHDWEYWIDERWRVAYCSPSVERVTGRPLEDFVNRAFGIGDLVVPEDLETWEAHEITHRSMEARADEIIRFRIRRADGEVRWLEHICRPIFDNTGTFRGYRVTNRDITTLQNTLDELETYQTELEDRVRLRTAELAQARDLAESAARVKSEFLANMSHEIRTPMNAIVGLTYLALKAETSLRVRGYLQSIQRSSEHLLGIINDILDFSKIEAGKLEIDMTDFDLERQLNNAVALVADNAAQKGLEIIIAVDDSVPPYLRGDPLRVGQILVNFTNNAVKFTEEGEITLRVTVDQMLHPDSSQPEVLLRFAVTDTGIGIDGTKLSGLFHSFRQVDGSITRKFGGTGLGLAISKRLAELMGGTVGVESDPGRGSTFWFTARFGISTKGPEQLPVVQDLRVDLRGKRVLLVDDNDVAREVIQEILRSMSLDVVSASTGIEAVERVHEAGRTEPYDIVLLDWKMPGMDGIETARNIVETPGAEETLLLMMTAFDRAAVVEDARRVGCKDVLRKPISPSTLFDTLMKHVGVGRPSSDIHIDPDNRYCDNSARLDTTSLSGRTALLVEDNEINQQVGRELLEELGITVDIAVHGEAAVDRVHIRDYDVVLMDMQMPVMDGVSATRKIRKTPALRDLPIIAMTANAMSDDRDRCLAAGMNDYISKPIDPNVLVAKLLKWISDQNPVDVPGRSGPSFRSSDHANEFTGIEGLDAQRGLQQTMGRPDLYRRIIDRFVRSQRDAPSQIRIALGDEDLVLAERTAHTLKGLAAQIGAEDIRAEAERAEREIRETRSASDIVDVAVELERTVPLLVDALSERLGEGRTEPEKEFAYRTVEWQTVRSELLELLGKSDTTAVELANSRRSLLRAALGNGYNEIMRAIVDYDFPVALTLLEQYKVQAGLPDSE